MKRILEICAADAPSVAAAAAGGADRVELCQALDEGGLTPSAGLIMFARRFRELKTHVLIRPRGGDFVYDEDEIAVMTADIGMARKLGADGVVIGALNPDGTVDTATCRRLIDAAGDMSVTFHRAFDRCREPLEALQTIIGLGCNRLLTSGQAISAIRGVSLIARLVNAAGPRLSVIAAAGVNPGNTYEIVRRSHVHEVHASARDKRPGRMTFASDIAVGPMDSDLQWQTDSLLVESIRHALDNI